MTVPGGSRRDDRNGAQGRDPRGAEPSLGSLFKLADVAANGEVGRNGEGGGGLVYGSAESECDAASGVWLSAEDGTVLFHPVSSGTEGLQLWSVPDAGSVAEANEMTLDAASRLMPLLPRELIAEYLQLGPVCDGGDAS